MRDISKGSKKFNELISSVLLTSEERIQVGKLITKNPILSKPLSLNDILADKILFNAIDAIVNYIEFAKKSISAIQYEIERSGDEGISIFKDKMNGLSERQRDILKGLSDCSEEALLLMAGAKHIIYGGKSETKEVEQPGFRSYVGQKAVKENGKGKRKSG